MTYTQLVKAIVADINQRTMSKPTSLDFEAYIDGLRNDLHDELELYEPAKPGVPS